MSKNNPEQKFKKDKENLSFTSSSSCEHTKITFNKNKAKNQMKEMLRKSEAGVISNNIFLPQSKNSNFKFNSQIELQSEKIIELEELKIKANLALERQTKYVQTLKEENKDSQKLISFYKTQIEEELKKFEEMESEEKKVKFREEKLIEECREGLSHNMLIIHNMRDECYKLEASVSDKDYKLASLRQKSSEMSNKINCFTLELSDKINLKKMKHKELEEKEENLNFTKSRIANLNRINEEYVDHLRMIHNDLQECKGNIRVFCRVRPPLPKEEANGVLSSNMISSQSNTLPSSTYIEFPNYNTIILNGPVTKSNVGKNKETQNKEIYKFDRVFGPSDTQAEVFKEISQLVQSALDGYNVCIFAYGQTGSGKTYTMEGEEADKRGIIPRSIEQIFSFKSMLNAMGWNFSIEASCVEIYNDQVRDLLMSSNNNIISQNNNKIDKFTVFQVKSVDDLQPIVEMAAQKRAVAETMCNEKSSRSHCIFQLKIHGKNIKTKQERTGALNLIDLAGSERVSSSKVEGERLKETIAINKSLTHLKTVITALINNSGKSHSHIPYRDSILTWILREYLGGESKTLMFVNISPLISNFSESSCSLKFAADVNSCYLKSVEDK
jgi:kinesin family protein C1